MERGDLVKKISSLSMGRPRELGVVLRTYYRPPLGDGKVGLYEATSMHVVFTDAVEIIDTPCFDIELVRKK